MRGEHDIMVTEGQGEPPGLATAPAVIQLAYQRRMCEAAYSERNRLRNALEIVVQHAGPPDCYFRRQVVLTPSEWQQIVAALGHPTGSQDPVGTPLDGRSVVS